LIKEGRVAMSVEKPVEHFSALADPRCAGKVEHRLTDILVIAVGAVIACAESWDDIALYGRNKLGWLQSFLTLANGVPSHDTFRRVFMLIDPDAFEACFSAWAQSFAEVFHRDPGAARDAVLEERHCDFGCHGLPEDDRWPDPGTARRLSAGAQGQSG
jgi:hypothetical protein